MKGGGQLTEEISRVRYDQTEEGRTRRVDKKSKSLKSWSERKKENLVSMVPLRQRKERDSRKSWWEGREGLRHQPALDRAF